MWRGPFYYMVLFGLCSSRAPTLPAGRLVPFSAHLNPPDGLQGVPSTWGDRRHPGHRAPSSMRSLYLGHGLRSSGFRLQIAHRCPQCSLRRVRARCLLAFGGLGGTVLSTSRTRLRATLLSVRVLSPEVTLPVRSSAAVSGLGGAAGGAKRTIPLSHLLGAQGTECRRQ